MSGIAGIISAGGSATQVQRMLDKIDYRGPDHAQIVEFDGSALGAVWGRAETSPIRHRSRSGYLVEDSTGPGHFARVEVTSAGWMLRRGPFGVVPLYFGHTQDGGLCFASEVKALLDLVSDVHELQPGHTYTQAGLESYFELEKQPTLDDDAQHIAGELQGRLAAAVERRARGGEVGSWLSGGLDSSAMAALARPHVDTLHTFAAGVPGAPDLEFAREVAEFIDSCHHEVVVTFEQMLEVLPDVIYHLESFDALLVRSSITNFLVARLASDYVPAVFSGEGADELFAGYDYLKSVEPERLADELVDITGRLHNTALQRVDRSASAHGTVAHVGFLDPHVVDYALRIPARLKLRDGVEKWIVRRALEGVLPDSVLNRTKAKFWQGAGVGEQMAAYAEEQISDAEFAQERELPNGWNLNTKEELLYWRIFRERFGQLVDLGWMGRTKGAPRDAK